MLDTQTIIVGLLCVVCFFTRKFMNQLVKVFVP